jgi:hypothetical protein
VRLAWRREPRVHRGRLFSGSGCTIGREVHAASFLRERRLILDSALRRTPSELTRILVHELFHFVWLRLGNARRASWRELLEREFALHARGELGWSAEHRKTALLASTSPSKRLRAEYACESFCDTAAWIYSGIPVHPEFTLATRYRSRRRTWFTELERALPRGLSI